MNNSSNQHHSGSGDNVGGDKFTFHLGVTHQIPKDLTGNLPPPLSTDQIFGRQEELGRLISALEKSRQVALVNGFGGIGKSTLARLYLDQYLDQFDHIVWLTFTGDSFDELIASSLLPESLGINRQSIDSSEKLLPLVFQILKELTGNNLFVIDNADNIEEINKYRRYLPQGLDNWKTLITSRGIVDGFTQVPIDTLSLEDAQALFLAYYPAGSKEPKVLEELLHLVGLHTLTIELMAKTLAKSRRLSGVAELLEKVKDKKYEDPKLLKEVYVEHKEKWPVGSSEEAKRKIKGIYQYLLAVFDLGELNPQEQWVMKLLALFPTRTLNTETFFKIMGLSAPENEEVAAKMDDSLDSLIEQGWLQSQRTWDNSESIFLHRILKELVLFKLKSTFDDSKILINGYLGFASIEEIDKDIVDRLSHIDIGESLLAYFTIVPGKIGKESFFNYKVTLSRLNKVVGHLLQYQGNYQKTLHCYSTALALVRELAHQNDEELFEKEALIISYQGKLGTIYENMGNYEKAQTLFKSALSKAQNLYGPEALEVAHHLSNLGLLYREVDDFMKAKYYLEQSQVIRKKHRETDSFNYVINLGNLGLVYYNLGLKHQNFSYQYKAKELLESALEYHKKYLGPDAPDVATVQGNLSQVYSALNEDEKAHTAINDSLRIDLKNFGEKHPYTAGRYLTRGVIYSGEGEKEKAKADFKKALELYLITVGEDHPHVQNAREFITEVNSGRYERMMNNLKLLNQLRW